MVRQVSYSVQDLVGNILYSDMTPEKKSAAIRDVGDGFGKRVKSAVSEIKKELEDIELLEIEAITAQDARHIPFTEKIGDFISKAKLTSAAEEKLSDDDFALVVTRDGQKVRKYPIHDKAHVRNALARAAQMIEKGGDAAADAKAALPKIGRAHV